MENLYWSGTLRFSPRPYEV